MTPNLVISGSAAVSSPSVWPSRSKSRSRRTRRPGSASARKTGAISSVMPAMLCDLVVTCQAYAMASQGQEVEWLPTDVRAETAWGTAGEAEVYKTHRGQQRWEDRTDREALGAGNGAGSVGDAVVRLHSGGRLRPDERARGDGTDARYRRYCGERPARPSRLVSGDCPRPAPCPTRWLRGDASSLLPRRLVRNGRSVDDAGLAGRSLVGPAARSQGFHTEDLLVEPPLRWPKRAGTGDLGQRRPSRWRRIVIRGGTSGDECDGRLRKLHARWR